MKFSNRDYQWLLVFILVIIIIIGIFTLLIANSNYTISFKMDNNTLEAFKSINWSAIPR